jgi:hypothetical protein
MALGAFVAGLLLAETEYRREIETTIEPFKGFCSACSSSRSARVSICQRVWEPFRSQTIGLAVR